MFVIQQHLKHDFSCKFGSDNFYMYSLELRIAPKSVSWVLVKKKKRLIMWFLNSTWFYKTLNASSIPIKIFFKGGGIMFCWGEGGSRPIFCSFNFQEERKGVQNPLTLSLDQRMQTPCNLYYNQAPLVFEWHCYIFLFSIIRVGITLIPIGCRLLSKLEIFRKFRNFFFILFEKWLSNIPSL